MTKQTRLKLIIGKFPIKRVVPSAMGFDFYLDLPGLGLLAFPVPRSADVREGDLLSIYTEVLTKGPPNA
jgi:hypothetical protein